MSRVGARYISGALAGASLAAIVVWVVDQLRRDAGRSERDHGSRSRSR
jgi:hypothetical protein